MAKFQLVLLIHAHQPVGNFDDVLERAYQQSYLPFIEVLARHPSIRLGLHYSGSLLEWIEHAHPEYFEQLHALVTRGQIEIVGGGFYEPILVVIPPEDRLEQITRLADYIEKHFGTRPRGAWLAERVWEPQLPSSLRLAGVEYTLVDDNHFLGAGFELEQLYGYYTSEDECHAVSILPGLKALRYLLPFRAPQETTEFLRRAAAAHPGGFAAMGDDLEKFGVWPGTHDHCYRDAWLEKFFTALEQSAEWFETSTPVNAISSHTPLGRADLPASSYSEMMEWSLPTPARNRYHALTAEFSARPEVMAFLHGGIWRNFFTKYCESNLLHKKMQHVSKKVRQLKNAPRNKASLAAHEKAKTLVLRSQCNDAYWHGVFGGLYSPHLRTALWRSLIQAEAIADGIARNGKQYEDAAKIDFDSDGHDEIYFNSDRYAALLVPDDGASISAVDCRQSNSALINSLCRRPESYHAGLKNLPAKKSQGVQSIHEQTRTKEDGLERWLNYDRWPNHAFRVLLFGREKNYQDYAGVRLGADAALAAGRYHVVTTSPTKATLISEENADWPAEKTFSFGSTPAGFDIICDVAIKRTAPGSASVFVGIETIVNFLAPSAPDRYFETNGQRYPLRWGASTVASSELRIVDEWQGVTVTLVAPKAQDFWVAPIETVSESEDGFERIYQGSQILAVWPVELSENAEWKGKLVFKVSRFES